MKVKRHDTQKRYLFIQMNGSKIELGFVSLIDAVTQAQRMTRRYFSEHLMAKSLEVQVMCETALKDEPRLITTISA